MTSTHNPLELENFLPYRLAILSNTVSGGIAREYQQRFTLSMPEWHVMAVLGRWRELSANEVVARTLMDKVAVSRAVSRLIAAGRIERRIDLHDRRRHLLCLTKTGWDIHNKVTPMARRHEQALTEKLDKHELDLFLKLLDKLAPAETHAP